MKGDNELSQKLIFISSDCTCDFFSSKYTGAVVLNDVLYLYIDKKDRYLNR
jgi:hypothetical protein